MLHYLIGKSTKTPRYNLKDCERSKGVIHAILPGIMFFCFFRFSYYGSFGAGATCSCMGFFLVQFTFKETNKDAPEISEKNTSITSLDNIVCSFKCLFKKRSQGMRHIVILLTSCMVVS